MRETWSYGSGKEQTMARTKGVSLAKGPVAIIGVILLAGGILGLLMGSTSFTADPIRGDVTGGTFLGIEGNGWTWVLFAGAGAILLLSAPLHWGAKMTALIVGAALGVACVLAVVDGNDALGIFAANNATMVVLGAAAVALLIVAMLPRVGRREEAVVARERGGRFRRGRREERAAAPVGRRRT
jgi:hypothetical protein